MPKQRWNNCRDKFPAPEICPDVCSGILSGIRFGTQIVTIRSSSCIGMASGLNNFECACVDPGRGCGRTTGLVPTLTRHS